MFTIIIKFLLLSAAICPVMISRVSGQTQAECTTALINGLNPCMSYVTGRTNGSAPGTVCCGSLLSLTSTSSGCLCLLNNINGPFGRVSFNRTLALSLPGACSIPSVQLDCKDAATTQSSTAMPPVTTTEANAPMTAPPAPLAQVLSPPLPPTIGTGTVLQNPTTSSSQRTYGFSFLSMFAVLFLGSML